VKESSFMEYLWQAVGAKNTAVVRAILSVNGKDLANAFNGSQGPVFHYAVAQEDPVLVKTLLDHKADPNLCDANGVSALTKAMKNMSPHVGELLLECKGLDPNLQDCNRHTALAELVLFSYDSAKEGLLRKLLRAGADPNHDLGVGSTIFTVATQLCDKRVQEILVEFGANVDAHYGDRSLIQIAMQARDEKRVRYMLSMGANLGLVEEELKAQFRPLWRTCKLYESFGIPKHQMRCVPYSMSSLQAACVEQLAALDHWDDDDML